MGISIEMIGFSIVYFNKPKLLVLPLKLKVPPIPFINVSI